MTNDYHYASVNGIRLAYETAGSGYPLLLIHGFPRDRRLWRKVTPGLAARFTVVAMDRRGYGESDRPSDAAGYDNRTMAADALGLARALGWDKFLVAGHDRGAPVAQRLAADHRENITGLVMLDSLPFGLKDDHRKDPSGRSWYMDFFRQRGVAEQIMGQNPGLFFSLFLERHPHLTPEEHKAFLNPFCRPGSVEAVLADYRHATEGDAVYWKEWFQNGNKIATPVCALWAEKGPVAKSPVLEAWRTVAHDVRGAMISDCAHYLQEQQPDLVVRHIIQFADELGVP
ncbi:MAG TPA: alpha/beta hydrolase [Candidatus Binatia bacterium]